MSAWMERNTESFIGEGQSRVRETLVFFCIVFIEANQTNA